MLGSTLSLDVSVAVSCVRTCNNPCVSQYCVYHCVIVGQIADRLNSCGARG